jgi:PAS domain S-box-containing protein
MSRAESTQLLPAPVWEDPRTHLLDDIWLLTIFTILLAIALPWLASSLEVSLAGVFWGLLALGAIHMGFTAIATPSRAATAWRRRALCGLHLAGIVIIGIIWRYSGGAQNPAFLAVFALPIVGAIFLSRWQPYLAGLVAVLTVTSVALEAAPELRWYVSGLNGAGAWLAARFGPEHATLAPFPGFYAPAGYYLVLLEVFTVLVFACAVAAEYLGTVFERLHAHISVARAEAERGQELWASLIEQLPVPAVLIDSQSQQIVCASERLAELYGAGHASLGGRNLFEVLSFSYPEMVQELIAGVGGTSRGSVIRHEGRLHITNIRVQHVAQRGQRFALLLLEDATEDTAVRAALDAAEHAALVIDAQGRVLAFNRPAMGLFSGIALGVDASALLAQPDSAERWWEPGLAGKRKMHARILPRIYQVTSSAVALPGEDERMYVVAFAPVARAAAASDTATAVHDAGMESSRQMGRP